MLNQDSLRPDFSPASLSSADINYARNVGISVALRLGMPIEVAVSDADYGLVQAASRYRENASSSLRTFAYRRIQGAVKDNAASHSRSVQRERRAPDMAVFADTSRTPEDDAIASQRRDCILSALQTLPATERDALLRAYFPERLEAGRAESTVSRFQECKLRRRGLQRLREQLAHLRTECFDTDSQQ